MRTKIAFLIWSTLGTALLTIGIGAFAPFSYVASTTLVKSEGEMRLLLTERTHRYVQEHNIYEQKCFFLNHNNKINLKYSHTTEQEHIYECYFITSESIDSGIYKLNLVLGEIKLWMILINII